MRTNVTFALALLSGLCLSASGCKKRVAITGAEASSSPEGRACPKNIGLIADGENNSNQIADIEGRGGYWYTFVDDGGSSVVPEAGKNGGTFQMSEGGHDSKYAAHMSGKVGGGSTVYVGMGFNFVDPKGQYDASKYKGITFWAKKGPGGADQVKLKVPDKNTDPDGKVCTECFNDFGMDITLHDEWTQYTILFTSMKQDKTWGKPHPDGIEPGTIYGVQFQFNQPNTAFDMWLDDVEFTGCGG